MKKLLVALALLTVSTVGYADDDRYKVTAGYSVDYPVIIVDTKTGDIAYCKPMECRIYFEYGDYMGTFSGNFKEAFKQKLKRNQRIK